MELQKSLLKRVFGGIAVAREACQETEKIVLVTIDQHPQGGAIALDVAANQCFIAHFGHGDPFEGPRTYRQRQGRTATTPPSVR